MPNKPRGKPFAKGNKQAKGGSRPMAGPPVQAVREAARLIFQGKAEAAMGLLDEALRKRSRAPWASRLKAAELVLAYAYGRPPQELQLEAGERSQTTIIVRRTGREPGAPATATAADLARAGIST